MTAATTPGFGAILLAGGRASRMGGIAKPLLDVDGATLLDHAIRAARDASCRPITVVGPEVPGLTADDLTWAREDPPFGGPAAGVIAALGSWTPEDDPDWTLVLACDLPRVRAAATHLVGDILLLPSDTDGLCLADAASRPQWLTGVYRTSALRTAAARVPESGSNASMRALLDDLAIAVVTATRGEADDIDTWEDLNRLTYPGQRDPSATDRFPKETP